MYILKLKPVLKDYIWGGDRLVKEFNMPAPTDSGKAAEAWVLSCHKDGPATVTNGIFEGKALSEILTKEMMGTNCEKFGKFPILTKIIDSGDNLSLQVHPSDETADKSKGEEAKTESWYIADCCDGAELIYGFKEDITKDEFVKSVNDGTFIDKVNKVKVKKGECYHIAAGTLHAICKGILLVEVQQNSNTTFRVYDYDRVDKNGNKRELHVDRALAVLNYKKQKIITSPKGEEREETFVRRPLSKCEFYNFCELKTFGNASFYADEKSFVSYICIEGEGRVKCDEVTVELKKGDSIFVPASLGKYEFCGEMTLLETRVD